MMIDFLYFTKETGYLM